jgi:hypothetical protein
MILLQDVFSLLYLSMKYFAAFINFYDILRVYITVFGCKCLICETNILIQDIDATGFASLSSPSTYCGLLTRVLRSSKQTILRDACSRSDAYDQDSLREIKIQVLILLRNGFYYTEEGSVK